jgi:hypothetical protein
MFSVIELKLNRSEWPISSVGLDRSSAGWELKSGVTTGTLLLDPFVIKFAYKWEGIEIFTDKAKIAFAVPTVNTLIPTFKDFIAGAWQTVSTPVYYSAQQARPLLLTWSGPLQVQLRLDRPASTDPSPLLRVFRIGYHTFGDMVDYAFRFQLTKILRVLARITRTININGTSFAPPAGFSPGSMGDTQLLMPRDGRRIVVTPSTQLTIPESLVNETGHLHFNYPLAIDPSSQILPQIDKIPIAIFRNVEVTNSRHLNAINRVRTDDTTVLESIFPLTWDVNAEVVIFADNLSDARLYAAKVAAKIKATGVIDSPAYGHQLGLHLMGTVRNGPIPISSSGSPSSGSLYSAVVKFRLSNLIGNAIETYRQKATVDGIVDGIVDGS